MRTTIAVMGIAVLLAAATLPTAQAYHRPIVEPILEIARATPAQNCGDLGDVILIISSGGTGPTFPPPPCDDLEAAGPIVEPILEIARTPPPPPPPAAGPIVEPILEIAAQGEDAAYEALVMTAARVAAAGICPDNSPVPCSETLEYNDRPAGETREGTCIGAGSSGGGSASCAGIFLSSGDGWCIGSWEIDEATGKKSCSGIGSV